MPTTRYEPVDCGDYDFLEIACMDRYDVELHITPAAGSETCVSGVASRLEASNGEEFLWLCDESGTERAIRVDRIRSLTVRTRPCRFEYHAFARNP